MEKTLIIDGHQVRLKTTASTPLVYRNLFNSEIFDDVQALTEEINAGRVGGAYSTLVNIAYTMAYQADREIPDKYEWLDQFEMFSLANHINEILEVWGMNTVQLEESKKKGEEQSGN